MESSSGSAEGTTDTPVGMAVFAFSGGAATAQDGAASPSGSAEGTTDTPVGVAVFASSGGAATA